MSDALTEISKAAKNEVVFLAKHGSLTLVRRPKVINYNEVGQTVREIPALRYEFKNSVLRVRPGRDIETDPEHTLRHGEDTGVKRDSVEWLKAHPDFNTLFWIEGEEPGKPRPFVEQVIKEMSDAVARVDVERLQALLDAERSTHNRPLLTGALTSALESVSAVAAEYVAQEAVGVHGDGENGLEWHEGMTVEELAGVAERAEIEPKGTGADGNVLKADYVKALRKATKATEKQS